MAHRNWKIVETILLRKKLIEDSETKLVWFIVHPSDKNDPLKLSKNWSLIGKPKSVSGKMYPVMLLLTWMTQL